MSEIIKNQVQEIDSSNPIEEMNIQNSDLSKKEYIPVSQICNTSQTVAPATMLIEMNKNLLSIDRQVRGIDYFVMEKLHYKDVIELCDAFNAEQVDAIAAAIFQLEQNKGMIIGDMTGIGKGRVAAGIMRYAKYELNKKPIFITERPNLFSDIYRDIIAIGLDDGIPLRFRGDKIEKTIEVSKQVVIDAMKEDIDNDDFVLEGFDENLLFKKDNLEYTERAIEAYREEYFPQQIININTYETNKNYEKDIKGKKRFVPYIINGSSSKTEIKDTNGNILYKGLPSNQNYEFLSNKKITKDYDCVLATYSQFSSMKAIKKIDFITEVAKDNIIVMDESHNASGFSKRGEILQNVIKKSKGVVFLSATYAKRPDNMPIYSIKTNVSDAELSSEELIEAISSGGVALQEIISNQLVSEGQLMRRQRSYENIEINYITLDETAEEINPNFNLKNLHYGIADRILDIIRQIINFVNDEINPVIAKMREEHIMSVCGYELGNAILFGTKEDKKIAKESCKAELYNNSPFQGIFTIINQFLFSLKADAVAEWAIYRLKQGKKPIIALSSTLESVLDYAMSESSDNEIEIDFKIILKRRLYKTLEYTVFDKDGNSEKKRLKLDEISERGQVIYNDILLKIESLVTGINISPIDYIKKKISDAGFTIEEITGRNKYVEFIKNETLGILKNRNIPNTTDVFKDFNDNVIDCLIINQAGATGASAHAVKTSKVNIVNYDENSNPIIPTSLENKFEVKQRVMIILQAELDINKEIQKRGRIYRTGQVFNPIYDYLFSAIPSEKRLSMMLRKKLKSLDANTTSNQKESSKILDVVDFLNEYGDEVVYEILLEKPEINNQIGSPINIETDNDEVPIKDLAYIVTGRVAILNTDEQEEFYKEVIERYNAKEAKLKIEGKWNIEVSHLDLQAKTIEKDVIAVGNPEKKSVFGGATFIEKCEINNIRKPYTKSQVENLISNCLSYKNAKGEIVNLSIDEYKEYLYNSIDERAKAEYEYILPIIEKQQKIEIERLYKDKRINKIKNESEKELFLTKEKNRIIEIFDKRRQDAENIWNKANKFKEIIEFFLPKNVVEYYHNGYKDTFKGISIGVKMLDGKWLNSNDFILKIAFPSSLKYMEFPFYNMNDINLLMESTLKNYLPFQMSVVGKNIFNNWNEEITNSSSDRVIRYIISGNILKAFRIRELKNRNNKLVKYSTIDKKVKNGILMYEKFDPNELTIKVPLKTAIDLTLKSIDSQKTLDFGDESIVFLIPKYDYYVVIRRATRLKRLHIDKNNELLEYLDGSWSKKREGDYVNFLRGDKNIIKFVEIMYSMGLHLNMNFKDWKVIAQKLDVEDRFENENPNDLILSKYYNILSEYEKNKNLDFKNISKTDIEKLNEIEKELYELKREKANNKVLRFFVESLNIANRYKEIENKSMSLGGQFNFTLGDLQQDESLVYISDPTEIKDIITHFDPRFYNIDEITNTPIYENIGGLFVRFENGNISKVYGFEGNLPSLDKPAFEIYPYNQYF
jgi:hypothetical protein